MIKKIFLVHHSHTDIGYTDVQAKVVKDHVRFIDKVLDYCRETDNFPEESKFRWTCETSWMVRNYLENRPERTKEFIRRVKEGRIEVTGLYLNVTDLYTAEELIRSGYFIKELERRYGIRVVSAMNSDINGLSWSLPQILSKTGIKYLSMSTNLYRSFRPEVPYPFYWLSPDGSRVLAWNSTQPEMLTWYDIGYILGFGDSYETVRKKLPDYLKYLEGQGYPYDAYCIRTGRDNVPPHIEVSRIVRRWNEEGDYPEIRVATNKEFFEYMERKYKNRIPSYKLAWPDWWADGNISCAYETGLSRNTHRKLLTVEGISSILSLFNGDYPEERLKKVWENTYFFDEHTFGAPCSVKRPYALQSRAQWAVKSSFAYQAGLESRRLLMEKSAELAGKIKCSGRSVVVFNSMPYEMTGLVSFRLPKKGLEREEIQIKEWGKILPCQIEKRERFPFFTAEYPFETGEEDSIGVSFLAGKIPSLGYRTYRIDYGKSYYGSGFSFGKYSIENKFYEVTVSPVTGGIESIKDKELNKELVDGKSHYKLNQYIYEEIVSKEGRGALFDDTVGYGCLGEKRRDAEFRRTSPVSSKIKKGKCGPLAGSLIIETKARGCHKITQEVILYSNLKRIDIENTLLKEEVLKPEGVYYAFPFNFKNPKIKFEIAGGVMRPEVDQLPHTAKDYYSVQDWVSISDKNSGIVWVTKEAPLVQFGGMNTGKWIITKLKIKNGTFFSYVMNNYHPTNFPGTQRGEVSFSYSITSSKGKINNSIANRFARECCNPPVAVPVMPNPKGSLPEEYSFLSIDKENISILALKEAEDKKGIIIRLQEIEGRDTNVKISVPDIGLKKAWLTGIIEDNQKPLRSGKDFVSLHVPKNSIVTIRLVV